MDNTLTTRDVCLINPNIITAAKRRRPHARTMPGSVVYSYAYNRGWYQTWTESHGALIHDYATPGRPSRTQPHRQQQKQQQQQQQQRQRSANTIIFYCLAFEREYLRTTTEYIQHGITTQPLGCGANRMSFAHPPVDAHILTTVSHYIQPTVWIKSKHAVRNTMETNHKKRCSCSYE